MIDPQPSSRGLARARIPSRIFRPAAPKRPAAPGPGRLAAALAVFACASWWGLAGGAIELGVRLAQRVVDPRITEVDIRTNVHFLWMIPAAGALWLVLAAPPLALVGFAAPRRGRVLAIFAAAFLAIVSPLMAVRGLHPVAITLLAGGLAAKLATRLTLDPARGTPRRWVIATLPLLAATLAASTALGIQHHASRESIATAALPAAAQDSPNVLFVVLDTVRADRLSVYGYERDTTPGLRRLAQRGVVFDEARSPAPWTLPSHASMFTGRWPHELSTTVSLPLDHKLPTLAEHFARHGYTTAGFVANFYYCNAQYGIDRGFLHYDDTPGRRSVTLVETLRSSALGRIALEFASSKGLAIPGLNLPRKFAETINTDVFGWLDSQPAGPGGRPRPFFAFVNYFDAHGPYIIPHTSPRPFGSTLKELAEAEAKVRRLRRTAVKLGHGNEAECGGEHLGLLNAATSELSRVRSQTYDDCLAYVDRHFERLLAGLEERGLLANTLIVVTADHGEHLGERGLLGHGHSLYRPVLHVPLLFAGPGVPNGKRVATPVSTRDLAATLLDLLGHAEAPFPGRSLARHWNIPAPQSFDPVLAQVERQVKTKPNPYIPASNGPVWAVVDRGFTYIRHGIGREELFALDDAAEAHDLISDPAYGETRSALGATLDHLLSGRDLPQRIE
jgi:arylsulfatase A-like enzyme